MAKPSVQHGELIDVIGRPRTFGGMLFLAALVSFDETIATVPQYTLTEHMQRNGQKPPFAVLPPYWESLWVRARIPRVFEFTPLLCANNWRPLVDIPFLAVPDIESATNVRAYSFVCLEGYRPEDTPQEDPLVGLCFSSRGPDKMRRQAIASCFWSLLLEEPQELESFIDMMFRETSTGYSLVGFERGEFFVEEMGDYDFDEDKWRTSTTICRLFLSTSSRAQTAKAMASMVFFRTPTIVQPVTAGER